MKKYKILALAIFACVTLNGWAQSEDNVTGRVLDEKGKPVAGALVSVEENPLVRVATDKNGRRTYSRGVRAGYSLLGNNVYAEALVCSRQPVHLLDVR